MTITLTNEEHTLLVSTISTHVAELREEIHRTEDYTYKMNLKHQKHLLNGLLTKLVAEENLVETAGH